MINNFPKYFVDGFEFIFHSETLALDRLFNAALSPTSEPLFSTTLLYSRRVDYKLPPERLVQSHGRASS